VGSFLLSPSNYFSADEIEDATARELIEVSSRREWCRTTDLYRVKVALYR
jgi:hypothetical protein